MGPVSLDAGDTGPRERWNRRWSERAAGAGAGPAAAGPAAWLAENAALLSAMAGERALDVACGDGRNAVYLARLGLAVDAVDISDVAIAAVRANAAAHRLPITARRMDLERDGLPADGYGVIVQIRYLQRSLFPALEAALTHGGIFVAETFVRSPEPEPGSAMAGRRFALSPGELRGAFPSLEIVRYQERTMEHRGVARTVAELAARRPL